MPPYRHPTRGIVPILTALGLWACGSQSAPHPPGDVFYGSWGAHTVPLTPGEPLTAAEAQKRDAWYVGTYNHAGQLVRFQKYLYGQKDWLEEYQYDGSGRLEHRRVVKADGSVLDQAFPP